MIDVKDLRIGSIVSTIFDETIVVNEIKKCDALDGIFYLINGNLCEHLFAIPLTSSILESCGFEDDKIENDKFKFEVYYYDAWNVYFEEKKKYGNSKCELIGFYDLHQLQNLYYDLTHQELEIKL